MFDFMIFMDEVVFFKLIYSIFVYDIVFNFNNLLLNEMINFGSFCDLFNFELCCCLINWMAIVEDVVW